MVAKWSRGAPPLDGGGDDCADEGKDTTIRDDDIDFSDQETTTAHVEDL